MDKKLSLLVNFIGIDKMSGAVRNIIVLGKKGSKSLGELKGESRKLESQLRDVRRELQGASGNITELTNRERQLEKAIDGVNKKLEKQKRLAVIESDRRAAIARADNLQQRGRDNIVQGASLAAPLILAVKAAGDYSSGLVDIQQKAELSNAATDKLGAKILLLADNAKQLPENVRAGVDLLLAKGLGVDEAIAAIGPASRLSTAYKVDVADAADAAYASINNLKVASSDTAKIFDVMATAGNEGGFEVRDMARHFPALTAQMSALGEKGVPAVADLSAALQVALNAAGSADEAGNNVKNLLAKINAPATINAFRKNFGVNLPAAMAKLTKEGKSSLEAITLITQQAVKGDPKKLGFAFEDQQARQGILALIQGFDDYRRIRDAALNSGGTVDKAFDQRVARDAALQWTAFTATISKLAIILGTTLLPVANRVLSSFSNLANGVAAWAQKNPEAAATVTKLVAGLAVFKIGLGVAQFALGGLLKPLANIVAFSAKLGGVARIFGVLRTASLFLARGVLQAGIMLLANPVVLGITLIVAAIGGAAYLIYTHWDQIKAAFWLGVAGIGQAWDSLKGFVQAGLNWFTSLPSQMLTIGKNILQGLANGITSAPGAVWNALKGVVLSGVNNIKKFLGIKSPSRLFMEIGGHTAAGLAIGIDKGRRRVVGSAGRLAASVAAAGSLAVAPAVARPNATGGGIEQQSSAIGGGLNITFNITQQPGQDAEELAEIIRQKLEEMAGKAARRSYGDDD